jgi:hypothetical protein
MELKNGSVSCEESEEAQFETNSIHEKEADK